MIEETKATQSSPLLLDDQARRELWPHLIDQVENYINNIGSSRAAPKLEVDRIRSLLKSFDFQKALHPLEAVDFVVQ